MEALHCGTAGRAFLCCCCCWTAPHCRICQPFYLQPLDFYTRESSHILHGHRLHPLSDTVAIGQGNRCGCDPYGFVLACSMFFNLVLSPTAVSSLPIIWSLCILKTIKFRSPQRQNGPHVEAMEIGKGKRLAPRCSGHMCNPSDCRMRAPALLCVPWGKFVFPWHPLCWHKDFHSLGPPHSLPLLFVMFLGVCFHLQILLTCLYLSSASLHAIIIWVILLLQQ